MGAALGDRTILAQSGDGHRGAARKTASLEQSAAGVVVGQSVSVRDSVIGLVVTPHLEGSNVRVLMDVRAALAFGAGVGVVLALMGLWGRRTRRAGGRI